MVAIWGGHGGLMGSGIWHKNANGKAKPLMGSGKMNNFTNGHGKWETVFTGNGKWKTACTGNGKWESGFIGHGKWELDLLRIRYQNFLRLASLGARILIKISLKTAAI